MQTVLSWLTSQSGVSLLVALIALGGVFLNNRAAEGRRQKDQEAADERRRKDQEAADKRRRKDQEVENKRREAEFAEREKERLRLLILEDAERQRVVIRDFIEHVQEIANEYSRNSDEALRMIVLASAEVGNDSNGSEVGEELFKSQLELHIQRKNFHIRVYNLARGMLTEITEPDVTREVLNLMDEIVESIMDSLTLVESYNPEITVDSWLQSGLLQPPHLQAITKVTLAARDHLQPVTQFIEGAD